MDNKYECQELKKIKNHPGLKNEEMVDLVVKYCVPVDKRYLKHSELVGNEHSRKNLNDLNDPEKQVALEVSKTMDNEYDDKNINDPNEKIYLED